MVDTWATVGSCAQIGEERATCRAAPASAACWSRCRPARSSSRTTASSARAPKSPKACIVGEGAVLSMGVYLGASTKIVDRATGEVYIGKRAALRRRRLRHDAGSRRRQALALLRRHRQERRRPDAHQDLDQRTAARLGRFRFLVDERPDHGRHDRSRQGRRRSGSGTASAGTCP